MFDSEFIVVIIFLIALIGIGWFAMIIAVRRRRTAPLCTQCGYNLTGVLGLSKRCPECGSDLQPAAHIKPGSLPTLWHAAQLIGFILIMFGAAGLAIIFTACITLWIQNG